MDTGAIMLRIRPRRTLTAVLLGAALLAGGATTADAARPHQGATYSGRITETQGTKVLASQPISFSVDTNGKTVSNFTLHKGYPVYCQPHGIGEAESVTAKIKGGKFRAVMPVTRNKKRQGSVTVTGIFASHGLESGKVITHFASAQRSKCNGSTKYQTQAKQTQAKPKHKK
jgi:hypothetical protein